MLNPGISTGVSVVGSWNKCNMSTQKTLADIQKDFQETLAQFEAKCHEFDRLIEDAKRLLNKLEKDEY